MYAELGIGVAIAAVVCYYAHMLYNSLAAVRKRWEYLDKVPGMPPHPIWGNVHTFLGPNEYGLYMLRVASKVYTHMTRFCFGPFNQTINLLHGDTMKVILKTAEPKTVRAMAGAYRFILPWLGSGLILADSKRWARNRRLLTPAFHFDILKPYMKINNDAVELFMDKLEATSKAGDYIELFDNVSQMTLDIILRCAFSYESGCQQQGKSHPYVKAVADIAETISYRFLNPLFYPDFIFYMSPMGRQFVKNCDYVHGVAEDVIKKRKQTLMESGGVTSTGKAGRAHLDFLDILLTSKDEDGKGLSDLEIREEVDTFLFAGHDTTASGISWALYTLSRHPEHQRKCQEEIDEILADRETDEILWEDLGKLKYVTQCLKESLRIYPPVPFIERQLTKDTEFNGYTIPKDTIVGANIYATHHNAVSWQQSTEFRPERFAPENMQDVDSSYAFVPFSAGPRNCIGQQFALHEMKTAITRVLRRYDLVAHPTHKVKQVIKVILKSENGMFIQPRRRVLPHREE